MNAAVPNPIGAAESGARSPAKRKLAGAAMLAMAAFSMFVLRMSYTGPATPREQSWGYRGLVAAMIVGCAVGGLVLLFSGGGRTLLRKLGAAWLILLGVHGVLVVLASLGEPMAAGVMGFPIPPLRVSWIFQAVMAILTVCVLGLGFRALFTSARDGLHPRRTTTHAAERT